MKKILLLFLLISTAYACGSYDKQDSKALVGNYLAIHTDSLAVSIKRLKECIDREDENGAHIHFNRARRHYKVIESQVEFYFPPSAEFINAPALLRVEEYDDKLIEPTGFQVIEENLFPKIDFNNKAELLAHLNTMDVVIVRLKVAEQSLTLTDENIFEALRLQLYRIISLGITGFDSPIAQHSLVEASFALDGITEITSLYTTYQNKKLLEEVSKAKEVLANATFNDFDRAWFIKNHLVPISKKLYDVQQVLGIANNKWKVALNMDATNWADASNINVAWFVPTSSKSHTDNQDVIALGKTLFFDPLLSGNTKRSCASCHKPTMAFTDGRAKSLSFDFQGSIARNSPSLVNSAFQNSQFLDSRFAFLEDQIADVMQNKTEMHGQFKEAEKLINSSDAYKVVFKKAFPKIDAISKAEIQLAIATYIRSLVGFNSKVDKYFRNEGELSLDELAGFNLFSGKAKCATCHFLPLTNGSIPPVFSETESEVLGVPLSNDTISAQIDSDLGKYHTYNRELHKYAFKTPTVRNAALTAPYMHNGVYNTLEEVIDFYDRGGGYGIGIDLPNQTLPTDRLLLSSNEKKQLIAFIHALTDTTGLTNQPTKLPELKDDKLKSRKVGGDY